MRWFQDEPDAINKKLPPPGKAQNDHLATHPDATVRFYASDMVLNVHSDASYLSESRARSRAAGHFFLGKKGDRQFNNGAVHTLSSIIKCVVSSASEIE